MNKQTNKRCILYLTLILLFSGSIQGMYLSNCRSGRTVVNGVTYEGATSVSIINGKVYINGILQNPTDTANFDNDFSTWKYEDKEEKKFEADNLLAVDMDNTTGNIDLIGQNCSALTLLISKLAASQEELGKVSAEISQTNNNLSIKTKYQSPYVKALINYKLCMPIKKSISYHLANASGDITAQELSGNFSAKTVSGNATLKQFIGNVTMETSSGDTRLEAITGNIEATTVSGKALIKEILGKAEITTSSGNIKLEEVTGSARAKTVSGQQTISDITEYLTCSSSSGDIKANNIGKNFKSRSVSGSIKAKLIQGTGEIETSSGDIEAAIAGSFNGKSVSGSITLKKDIINAPITMETSSGDITLSVATMNANLNAQTTSGEFESDFPVTITKQKSWQKIISAQIGNGGPQVELTSVSGDINLKKKI